MEERSTPADETATPKKRKCPNYVPRPLSPCTLFSVETAKQLMQDASNQGKPKPGVAATRRMTEAKWKNMSEEERRPFIKQAEQDEIQYQRHIKFRKWTSQSTYKPKSSKSQPSKSQPSKSQPSKLSKSTPSPQHSVKRAEASSSVLKKGKRSSKRLNKETKDSVKTTAPSMKPIRNPRSPYDFYCKQQRRLMSQLKIPTLQLIQDIREDWANLLTEEEKISFYEQAEADEKRYQREVQLRKQKSGRKRTRQDIRKPLTPYLLYRKQRILKAIQERNQKFSEHNVEKNWKSLSEEEKKPFVEKAKKDKYKYNFKIKKERAPVGTASLPKPKSPYFLYRKDQMQQASDQEKPKFSEVRKKWDNLSAEERRPYFEKANLPMLAKDLRDERPSAIKDVKKPHSACFLYRTEQIQKATELGKPKPEFSEVKKQWQRLSKEEKKPFIEQARQDEEKYQEEFKVKMTELLGETVKIPKKLTKKQQLAYLTNHKEQKVQASETEMPKIPMAQGDVPTKPTQPPNGFALFMADLQVQMEGKELEEKYLDRAGFVWDEMDNEEREAFNGIAAELNIEYLHALEMWTAKVAEKESNAHEGK